MTSPVDYCNVIFAGAPKIITNKLQRVLNSAARVVSGTRKFDRGLRQLTHSELHWLNIPERVKYKFGVITRRCLYGSAPQYLAACCVPVAFKVGESVADKIELVLHCITFCVAVFVIRYLNLTPFVNFVPAVEW